LLLLRGGLDLSKWDMKSGTGGTSIEDVYTPETLPGVGATTTYLHTQATVGLDWREASGYARRGGFYGVTAHDYNDRDDQFGFRQLDYEVIQHVPILREAWVLSLHGLAQTTVLKGDQQVPFFMLPSLGGGSNLRGYSSWRFRDRNSVLLQAEWRIMVNRFFDTAVFYDAGQVAQHKSDLNFDRQQRDYGFGARFHTPFSTVLRIDVARSKEGTTLVFATSPVF
jgi:hemolysin activation/secretion protein